MARLWKIVLGGLALVAVSVVAALAPIAARAGDVVQNPDTGTYTVDNQTTPFAPNPQSF